MKIYIVYERYTHEVLGVFDSMEKAYEYEKHIINTDKYDYTTGHFYYPTTESYKVNWTKEF